MRHATLTFDPSSLLLLHPHSKTHTPLSILPTVLLGYCLITNIFGEQQFPRLFIKQTKEQEFGEGRTTREGEQLAENIFSFPTSFLLFCLSYFIVLASQTDKKCQKNTRTSLVSLNQVSLQTIYHNKFTLSQIIVLMVSIFPLQIICQIRLL